MPEEVQNLVEVDSAPAPELIAMALQAVIATPSGNWWAGAAAGAFY